MKCPICNCEKLESKNSHCIFTNVPILRNKCLNCDLIFGPIDIINLPPLELIKMYKKLYSTYKEADFTDREVRTFLSMNPNKDGLYLNFGSGIWSNSSKIIKSMGYNIECYDFSFDSIDNTNLDKKYDGIMSHNVIEHLQSPEETFNYFWKILKKDGVMSHSTECYAYCYEYSIFHLYFLIGKSLQLLSDKTGFTLHDISSEHGYVIKGFKKINGV